MSSDTDTRTKHELLTGKSLKVTRRFNIRSNLKKVKLISSPVSEMYLPQPSSPVPNASSMTPKPRMFIQRCENGYKMRKLNDDVEEDNDSLQTESNITHAETNKFPVVSEPETAALVPHATKPETTEDAQKVCARDQLYKLCSVRHWKAPLYEFFNEDGPDNTKLFVVKVNVEIKEVSGITIVECSGDPHSKKKIAAEQAAEASLWFLKNVGHTL